MTNLMIVAIVAALTGPGGEVTSYSMMPVDPDIPVRQAYRNCVEIMADPEAIPTMTAALRAKGYTVLSIDCAAIQMAGTVLRGRFVPPGGSQ